VRHVVTDDVQVKTVSLAVRSSADSEFVTHNLVWGAGDTYTHAIDAVDLTGKAWFEYQVTVSDGTNRVTGDLVRVPVSGAQIDPVRLHLTENAWVSGQIDVVAGGDRYPADISLAI